MSDAKTCPDCGHKHEGPRLANICIGCPCERRDHDRDALLDWLDGVHRSGMRGESLSPTAHVAVRALLALARDAEGGGR